MVSFLFGCTAHYKHRIPIENCENGYRYDPSDTDSRNNIVVFTSRGGHAHTSAVERIKQVLGDKYDIDVVNAFDSISDHSYNYWLKRDYKKLINFFGGTIASRKFKKHSRVIADVTNHYYCKAKPAAVISVIPFLNKGLLEGAERAGIPFILSSVDLDLTYYLYGIEQNSYEKFYITYPFDVPHTRAQVDSAPIPEDHKLFVGVPLRDSFLTKQISKADARAKLKLPADNFTVMIMMGGAGSNIMSKFSNQLAKVPEDLSIIVATGKNKDLYNSLANKTYPKNISILPVGYTKEIAIYMSASDVLITKPGPTTLAEAAKLDLPVAIDGTSTALLWEKPILDYIESEGLGIVIKYFKETGHDISALSSNPETYQTIRNNLKKLELPDFPKRYQDFINQVFAANP